MRKIAVARFERVRKKQFAISRTRETHSLSADIRPVPSLDPGTDQIRGLFEETATGRRDCDSLVGG
jgi:hypothetical protein